MEPELPSVNKSFTATEEPSSVPVTGAGSTVITTDSVSVAPSPSVTCKSIVYSPADNAPSDNTVCVPRTLPPSLHW